MKKSYQFCYHKSFQFSGLKHQITCRFMTPSLMLLKLKGMAERPCNQRCTGPKGNRTQSTNKHASNYKCKCPSNAKNKVRGFQIKSLVELQTVYRLRIQVCSNTTLALHTIKGRSTVVKLRLEKIQKKIYLYYSSSRKC